jgi:hypothetical protein
LHGRPGGRTSMTTMLRNALASDVETLIDLSQRTIRAS